MLGISPQYEEKGTIEEQVAWELENLDPSLELLAARDQIIQAAIEEKPDLDKVIEHLKKYPQLAPFLKTPLQTLFEPSLPDLKKVLALFKMCPPLTAPLREPLQAILNEARDSHEKKVLLALINTHLRVEIEGGAVANFPIAPFYFHSKTIEAMVHVGEERLFQFPAFTKNDLTLALNYFIDPETASIPVNDARRLAVLGSLLEAPELENL